MNDPTPASRQRPARASIVPPLALALVGLTWTLMVVGAATRASRAGLACPDWPLCHGQWIPPLDASFYPANPSYAVYRVYLEFGHRVVAGLVSIVTLVIAARMFRTHRKSALALLGVLAAQVATGGVTVKLRNAPYTVVIHLALALSFLFAALRAYRVVRPAPERPLSALAAPRTFARGYVAMLLTVLVQMVLGAVVSSRSIGLACADFPLCNGLPLPAYWTGPIAWQYAHRVVGFSALFGATLLYLLAAFTNTAWRERRFTAAIGAGLTVQVLLGGINVWYQIPPPASAAHLGLAAALFAALAYRVLESAEARAAGVTAGARTEAAGDEGAALPASQQS